MAIRASSSVVWMFWITFSMESSSLKGLVREEPRMVPPREMMSSVPSAVRSTELFSTSPRQPSRNPTVVPPRLALVRTTARITAFSPGQSPPPVKAPIFIVVILSASPWSVVQSSSRSMNPVSTWPSTNAVWLKIRCSSGMVVWMPSIRNSSRARFMQRMASARVGRWTISLPISES